MKANAMNICGVIPVRLGSTRFPGKGLAQLAGKELVLHTYDGARQYSRFKHLIVATDDRQIEALIGRHGGEVFYSAAPYRNGSERCAAAIANIDCEICVNIQGDEVFMTADIIDRSVKVLERDAKVSVATAVFPITDASELEDRNLVKVALDENDHAISFSRRPITGNGQQSTNFGHVGIYAYRKEFLMMYTALAPTTGEISESLEQLRILESGYAIGVTRLERPVISINSPEDLQAASMILSREGGDR